MFTRNDKGASMTARRDLLGPGTSAAADVHYLPVAAIVTPRLVSRCAVITLTELKRLIEEKRTALG